MTTIRDAVAGDLPAINQLYNDLIDTTTVAWTEDHETLDDRQRWFARQQERGHPVLVAEVDDEVVGFASYGPFRGDGRWPGYRFTVEHTVHVRGDQWGLGIGRRLIDALLDRARGAGLHAVIGAIDGDNDASLAFHERLGFVEVARMPEIGTKFGRWLDLVLVQRTLD